MPEQMIYQRDVLAWRMPGVQKRLDALNTKAKKLCVGGFTMTVGEPYEQKEKCRGVSIPVTRIPLTIVGEIPMIRGWRFAAKIVHDEKLGNLIVALPGHEIPTRYRHALHLNCDHCHTQRFRTETFVLVNGDGQYKQVGRNCLQDFLGGNTPENALLAASFLQELAEDGGEDEDMALGWVDEGGDKFPLRTFLTATAFVIRTHGWVSRGQAKERGEASTASLVWSYLSKSNRHLLLWNEADDATAEAAIAWAKEVDPASDYLWNLSRMAQMNLLSYAMDGYAASMIAAYQKAVEEELRRAQLATQGGWLGQVGDKLALVCRLVRVIPIATRYGVSHLHKFVTEEGNDVSWMSSSASYETWVGKTVKVEGKVKAHKEYQGLPETVLTFCKVAQA
jgi:hypothetical protein